MIGVASFRLLMQRTSPSGYVNLTQGAAYPHTLRNDQTLTNNNACSSGGSLFSFAFEI